MESERTATMGDIPDRGSDTPPSSIKKVAGIGFKAVLDSFASPSGALVELYGVWKDSIRESVKKNDEERLNTFFHDLLNSKVPMDESVAKAMVDDRDFHAILRACMADIEAEKVDAYAALAIAIVTGEVAPEWRRHFILSLRDMSSKELGCLRSAFVARKFELIPSAGPSVDESDFLKENEPGSYQSIMIKGLVAKGFVFEGKLSYTGEAFIRSCTKEKELTPNAIGYKSWSGQRAVIVSYEIANANSLRLATSLQDNLRNYQIKSSIVAILGTNVQRARTLHTQAILLLGEDGRGIKEHSEALIRFADKVPLLVVETSEHCASLPEELKVAGVVSLSQDSKHCPEIIDWLLQFRNASGDK